MHLTHLQVLLLLVSVSFSRNPPSSNYTLSKNLATNNTNLQAQRLSGCTGFSLSYYGWTTPHVIQVQNSCVYIGSGSPFCSSVANLVCPNQSIDLDSTNYNEIVTYLIQLNSPNLYQISFSWFNYVVGQPPNFNGFNLYVNGSLILQKYDNSCTQFYEITYIQGRIGELTITFQSLGPADSYGINIDNLKVKEVIFDVSQGYSNQVQARQQYYTNLLLSNESYGLLIQSSINQNGVLRLLLGYAMQINHLPIYLYHNLNFSVNAKAFLQIFQKMQDLKSMLPQNYVFPNQKVNISWANSLCSSKYTFSSYAIEQSSQNNLNCMMTEIITLFCYDLEVSLLIFITIKAFIYLLKKFRIARINSKYLLNGYILLMLFDGKIEKLTFMFFTELQPFNSSSFNSKFFNLSLILMYFLSFCVLISLYFLFLSNYRKSARSIFDQTKVNIKGCAFLCGSMTLLNIFLGFFHRIAVASPEFQSLILIMIQLLHMFLILYCLSFKITSRRLRIVCEFILSFVRVALIVCYLISNRWSSGSQKLKSIIDQAQEYLFFGYIGIYVMAIFSEILSSLFQFVKILVKKCSSNKIKDINQLEEKVIPHSNKVANSHQHAPSLVFKVKKSKFINDATTRERHSIQKHKVQERKVVPYIPTFIKKRKIKKVSKINPYQGMFGLIRREK